VFRDKGKNVRHGRSFLGILKRAFGHKGKNVRLQVLVQQRELIEAFEFKPSMSTTRNLFNKIESRKLLLVIPVLLLLVDPVPPFVRVRVDFSGR
jgi:hypothetical protein